jgi:hypothetical protein
MKIVMFLILPLIGVLAVCGLYGYFSGFKYSVYSSKDPELSITMDYLSGWLYAEDRGAGDSFAQVVFYQPGKKKQYPGPLVALTVEKSSKVKFQPSTLNAMADDLLQKVFKFQDSRVISKSKTRQFGLESYDIELTYKALDKLSNIDAKLVPVRERMVIFERNSKFYLLRYKNNEQEFAKFNKAFSHMVKTLRFKD